MVTVLPNHIKKSEATPEDGHVVVNDGVLVAGRLQPHHDPLLLLQHTNIETWKTKYKFFSSQLHAKDLFFFLFK